MLPSAAFQARDTTLPDRGKPPFATDIRLPGQLYAIIARPPVLGWSLAGFDARAALRLRGVVEVVAVAPWGADDLAQLGGVAVLARDTWSARKGREALSLNWREDRAPIAGGERVAGFVVPETAETLAETPCATARVGARVCEVWACLDDPDATRTGLAAVVGLPGGAVVLHRTILGGRPGQGCNPCSAVEAALLSRAMRGAPVSLLWTCEDDIPFRACAGWLVG